jgi:competence protein ComEA
MIRMFFLMLAFVLTGAVSASAQVQIQESTVRVHVSGQVQRPGVYTLPRGSRGVDAIQAAGGISKGALLSELNLASVLQDGERLLIPRAEASRKPTVPTAAKAPRRTSSQKPRASSQRPLSLNRATLEELDALPGIGPTLAEEVLRMRSQKGGFRTLDELKEVPGIGERRFERLAPLLTL